MGILDTDAAAIYNDPLLSVAVRFGVQTTRGFLDVSTEMYDAGGQPAQVTATTLRIRTGSLTSLAVEGSIIADGTTYVIRSIAKDSGDGKDTVLLLAEED